MHILLVLLTSLVIFSASAKTISVYLYHSHPPFIFDPQPPHAGLAVDLVELLNQSNTNPDINFQLEMRPRARLNHELKPWLESSCQPQSNPCNSDWMVLFVTPFWGWGEKAEQRFGWVKLFDDADLVISPQQRKVDYQGLASFKGKVFGTVLGHKYPDDLQHLFDKGESSRQDVSQVAIVIERLLRNRVDVSIIQKSHLNFMLQNSPNAEDIRKDIYVAEKAFSEFTLQMMLPPHRTDLKQATETMVASKAWCNLLKRYQLSEHCG